MFREPRSRFAGARLGRAALPFTILALAGCGNDSGGAPQDPPPEAPMEELVQPASTRARVKRKSPALLAGDLAQALDLQRAELCLELGTHDCFETHDILLGGVEPYRLRIDEPLAVPSVAAPMAVDRIVLTACGERAARDLADPGSAVIFAELAAAGAADDPDARAAGARRLYERLLARAARGEEVDALVDFHEELAGSAQPARDWAQLACYAVATTTEFLFY